MTTKEFSVIMRATGGGQVQAELTRVGKAGEEAFARVGRASQKANTGLLNAGYQVQDVMVQWAAGTDPMRAVGQQLPQLLSGFGLLGVGLGTVTAALSVLLPKMFEMGDEAEEVRKRVEALADAMQDLQRAEKAANEPFGDLRDQYGAMAEAARGVLEIERQIAEIRASRALNAVGQQVSGMAADQRLFGALPVENSTTEYQRLNALKGVMALFTAEANLSREQLVEINSLMIAFGNASGPVAQAAAMRELRDYMISASDGGRALSEAGIEFLGTLTEAELAALGLARIDLASGIGAAADQAGRLAGNLQAAQVALDRKYDVYSGRGGDPRQFMGDGPTPFVYTGPALDANNNVVVKGGGGGGGMSDDMREARRIYESTRTDAEKFAEEQQRINDLFEKGYLDADTYARALDDISEKYLGAGDAAKFFDGVTNDLKASIIDLAMTGGASLDNLLKKLQEALYQGILFDEGPLAQLFGGKGDGTGGLLGGMLDWLTGGIAGKRAGGGSVHGGRTYLVGEKGPELFTPSNSGMITSHDRIGLGGGGATTVQVFDQRSGGDPVQTERRRGPSGEDLIIMTIRDATASGRMDDANRRFGLQPVKVRR